MFSPTCRRLLSRRSEELRAAVSWKMPNTTAIVISDAAVLTALHWWSDPPNMLQHPSLHVTDAWGIRMTLPIRVEAGTRVYLVRHPLSNSSPVTFNTCAVLETRLLPPADPREAKALARAYPSGIVSYRVYPEHIALA